MIKKIKAFFAGILDFFFRLSLLKKIIIIVIVLIVLSVINKATGKKESNYITEKATKSTVTQIVAETGNINTGASTDILSPTNGIVEDIYVKNGDVVKTGDPLFKINSTATEQEKADAYSNYLSAQNLLNTAQSEEHTLRSAMYTSWDTYYNLATGDNYENGDGTPKNDARLNPEFQEAQENWVAAEKEYKDQQTAVAQASAKVNSTWLLYQATQNADVKAQTEGMVANLAITSGIDIKANDPALTIVSPTGNIFVNVPINEIDISKIKEGQSATIDIDAIEDKSFKGTVDRVDSVGKNDKGVITYNVYIKLNENDPRIRSGMTSNVEINTEKIGNTLSVSNSAVKPYQGGHAVQILDKGKPKYIPVRIGIIGDDKTQILSGIKEGQEVIIGAKNAAAKQSPLGL
ncbi:MAG TPA: efflux RND transporter periplasmic adaptor subunit [Patescibacteria group bacterium]|nr:efflux RND transporter periplasmic adaptor subunit [Patescibacteria group bacterium]